MKEYCLNYKKHAYEYGATFYVVDINVYRKRNVSILFLCFKENKISVSDKIDLSNQVKKIESSC